MKPISRTLTTFLTGAMLSLALNAQPAPTGRVVVETVHFTTLDGTVTDENPDRTVAVYLPPSYSVEKERRFPVLYLLHGIGDTEKVWTRAWNDPDDPWGTVARLLDRGIASGRLNEMIVVMIDQRTRAGGSFYTDSTVTGRWEELTARELPAWADATYRTLARPESRGIAGHSMGGYGAIMIGMKHPDVFSVVYGMNPSTMGWGGDLSEENTAFRTVLDRGGWDELEGFYERGIIALSQAYSPNPDRSPFFVDFPFRVDDRDELVPNESIYAAWSEHYPANIAERYRNNLLLLRGLRFDVGTDDDLTHIPITARELSHRLTELEVPHVFEEYNGDHRNRLWGQTGRLYTEVLAWFSLLLEQDSTDEPQMKKAG